MIWPGLSVTPYKVWDTFVFISIDDFLGNKSTTFIRLSKALWIQKSVMNTNLEQQAYTKRKEILGEDI